MTTSQLEPLFSDFAKHLGLTLPQPFELPLRLSFDDITVTFDQRSKQPNALLIYTSLGSVPVEHELSLYRAFLEANLFWSGTADATIGVNSATREAIIAYSIDLSAITGENLVVLVEQFTVLTELWLRLIENPASAKDIQDRTSKFKLINN